MPTRRAPAYLPLAWPFIAFLAAMLVVGWVVVAATLAVGAYARLGISPRVALVILAVSLVGSALNIPIRRLASAPHVTERLVIVFGVAYRVPVVKASTTLLAVNVGGAVIPAVLSTYLLVRSDHLLATFAATVLVALVAYRIARPVRGVGIVVPSLPLPIIACLVAVLVGGGHPSAVAYCAGTLGTLIGADIAHLRSVPTLGAPIASIGGAGTFDAVFLAGLCAVMLVAVV
jgi:uncharacterized membrane protein